MYKHPQIGSETLAINQLMWWQRIRYRDSFPFQEVLGAYNKVGKHFVARELLQALARVRDELEDNCLAQTHAFLQPFLQILLDKYDGYYDYRSYLALSLLDLPSESTLQKNPRDPQQEFDRNLLMLMASMLKFELESLSGESTILPLRAASRTVVETRCLRSLKALQPILVRMDLDYLLDMDAPLQSARALVQTLYSDLRREEELRLQLSNVPVYVVHDEYMFIRILQCFETVFAWLCAWLRVAIDNCDKDIHKSIHALQRCNNHLQEAAPLFHVLSTLDPESFNDFRLYTEGASAIQSRNYKRVESLCRKPDPERLHSIAYGSVPELQSKVIAGHQTLDEVYANAKASGQHDSASMELLALSMEKFQAALIRWRQSHYSIAVRMLGKGTGTGYTEGTPYLNHVRNIPVFTSALERKNDE